MTPDHGRRRVRSAAIGGTVLAVGGVALAVGANPFPQSTAQKDPALMALQKRERALSAEATRVTAMNAARWSRYRAQLTARRQQIASASAAAQAAQQAPVSYVAAAPVARSGAS